MQDQYDQNSREVTNGCQQKETALLDKKQQAYYILFYFVFLLNKAYKSYVFLEKEAI